MALGASRVGLPLLTALGVRANPSANQRALLPLTEGPYYPPAQWRLQWKDWDADLTRFGHQDNSPVARGELLGLEGDVMDVKGRLVDGVAVEIWQCDSYAVYRAPNHPQPSGQFDPNFAGFGMTKTDGSGRWKFRTIRPVPYTIRAPHIHVKLKHPTFGEVTSQLFVADEPLNSKDFLWPGIAANDRSGLTLRLKKPQAGSDLQWIAQHRLMVPV